MHLHALTSEMTNDNWELSSVDTVVAAEIRPVDTRIFVARESDVDWVSAAVETALNKEANR